MNTLHLFTRTSSCVKNSFLYPITCVKDFYCEKNTKDNSSSSSSSESSSSDEEATKQSKKSDAEMKRDESRNKLNNLLQKIIQEEVVQSKTKLNLARPTNKRVKKQSGTEADKGETSEKQLVNAVKDVAKDIGGDVKQTESELLLKLLGPSENSVASSNLSEIMKGMKIDRDLKPAEQSRAEQVRNLLQSVKPRSTIDRPEKTRQRRPIHPRQKPETVVEKINLFGSEPLGIFTNKELKESTEIKTWESLYRRDLKLAVTHPPSNYFQQMILWTDQGKLWKFPIDNEQGLDEEKKVDFTQHIFLEEYLEPWCPPRGPVRHFMELVCVGLSKNPYITVQTKREHIEWYKNYFEDKKKLLQEVGAFTVEKEARKTVD